MFTNSEEKKILGLVTRNYRESDNYNGYELNKLKSDLNISWPLLANNIEDLVIENKVRLLFSDEDINFHIIRYGFSPMELQLSKLRSIEELFACAYPTPEYLSSTVDQSQYIERPFSLRLALGDPQLAFRPFDLSVLDIYRHDRNFDCRIGSGGAGWIRISNEGYDSKGLTEGIAILRDFHFALDNKKKLAVAVYLRYLNKMGPEHQQIWKKHELEGYFEMQAVDVETIPAIRWML